MAATSKEVTIAAPNIVTGEFTIRGTAPYVQNKFSHKAREEMKAKQAEGNKSKNKRNLSPKDFEQCYRDAMHIAADGWHGIPAPSFRNAMISACKICGFVMTRAKLSLFVREDGSDPKDGTPLVRITKGEPIYHEAAVRNESGVADIRPRPMWQPGWEAVLRVRWDADQFTEVDVANLLMRAGLQVGIGEGRPDSKKSNGMGWGTFEVIGDE